MTLINALTHKGMILFAVWGAGCWLAGIVTALVIIAHIGGRP